VPLFETSDGVRLYWELWGDGEPCVVIDPGWVWSVEISSDVYRPLVRGGVSVLTYERRGTGRSDRPDPDSGDYSLERLVRDSFELVEHAGGRRRVALGSFDGARIAVRHAVQRAEDTLALILVAPALYAAVGRGTYEAFRELLRQNDYASVIRQLIIMSSPGWTEEERAEYVDLLRDNTTTAIGNVVWDGFEKVDDRPLLDRVRCPVLVVSGKQQIVPDPERVAEVVERAPGAELLELEGTAIMPRLSVEDPAGAILEFLRKNGIQA
jgi:pimeloyl-ACP methyl ester carboxylesterase